MESNKKEIEYCKCEFAGMINDGDGIDINCYYCGKEVEGMRNNFNNLPNATDYVEWEKGRFTLKNIIIKETTIYHQTENVEISYISIPKTGIDKASITNKNIDDAFVFNNKSSLLKFHPIENRNTIHIHYGNGICKTEWIYVDKEPNDENFSKVRNSKDIKISVRFPKVVKDSKKRKNTRQLNP